LASSQFEPFSQWSPADLFARDEIEGPVSAEIVRVIDGDTLLVEATPWPPATNGSVCAHSRA
jgi:endonuclease YncB( thermonuclease family)